MCPAATPDRIIHYRGTAYLCDEDGIVAVIPRRDSRAMLEQENAILRDMLTALARSLPRLLGRVD